MSKVVILTASFGMGHNSVSNAIKMELEENSIYDIVIIKDLFEIVYPKLYSFFIFMYKYLTVKHPKIYSFLYSSRNKKSSLIDKMMYSLLVGRVEKYISMENPDLVISTFPMCSGYISKLKDKCFSDLPLVTVITDVVYGWEWIHKNTDVYLVPSMEVKNSMIVKGISYEKIYVSGIPVKKEFKINYNNKILNKKLLIMGNILNLIEDKDDFLEKLDSIKVFKTSIITGNDKELYSHIQSLDLDNINVIGYTKNMNDYMKETDLILTKPGGVTIFEAINIETPICTFKESFGQEQTNIDFIRNNNIGRILYSEEELLKFLKIYYRDSINKRFMVENMIKLKNTFEIIEICNFIENKFNK